MKRTAVVIGWSSLLQRVSQLFTTSLDRLYCTIVFEGRASGYCTSQNYLLLASVVWALCSSWSYKTQLLSETVCEAWVLFLQRSTKNLTHVITSFSEILLYFAKWRNHVCQIFSRSVHGLRSSDTPKIAISHWLAASPLQQCSTAVRHCERCILCQNLSHPVIKFYPTECNLYAKIFCRNYSVFRTRIVIWSIPRT